jgi:hypothetical protein
MPKPSQAEIDALRWKAQRIAFAAEDEGESDERAEAIYQTLSWIAGDTDTPDLD